MSVSLTVKSKDSANFPMICHLPVSLSSFSTIPLTPPLPWFPHIQLHWRLSHHLGAFVPDMSSAWNVLHGLPTSSLSFCLCWNVTWGFLWFPYKNSPFHSLSPSLSLFHSSNHDLACYLFIVCCYLSTAASTPALSPNLTRVRAVFYSVVQYYNPSAWYTASSQ